MTNMRNSVVSLLLFTGILTLVAHVMQQNCTGANRRPHEQKSALNKPRAKHRVDDFPPEYEVVYPYVSDKYGKPFDNTVNKSPHGLRGNKHKLRHTRENRRRKDRLFIVIKTKNESLLLNLRRNKMITLNHQSVGISDEFIPYEACHYNGRVNYQKTSLVALSNCNGLSGLIRTSYADYFIEPKYHKRKNITIDSPHIVYRVQTALSWKNVSVAGDFLMKSNRPKRHLQSLDFDIDDDDFMPIEKSTKLYLETLIAADETLEKIHGKKRTAQYIMTLMNIVSTIYADAALNAHIAIVVVQIIFVNKERDNIRLVPGDNQASIESIRKWANQSTATTHDLTLYLTRDDLGGPAGFAPLASICEKNSCAVTRDGGLTSAFVLSHEIAHVLGLSHDGNETGGNKCKISAGSIMSPIVNSTFDHYHWSECSIGEFHKKREFWKCMKNKPIKIETRNLTSYSFDEQCRQEFGEGYFHCRKFMENSPCRMLWCTNGQSEACSSRNGPPLEGTICKKKHWCKKQACVPIKTRSLGPFIHVNPVNGGWNEWGQFGQCSRTCGTGVQFRTRKCDNPMPANNGRHCDGPYEESRLCNLQRCREMRDFRAEQCKRIGKTITNLEPPLLKFTWLPHPLNDSSQICKIICLSENGDRTLTTEENFIDGTLCHYNGSKDMCIQGECQLIGCDNIKNSKNRANLCGICNGRTSQCQHVEKNYSKLSVPTIRFSRVAVIPKRARHILIQKTSGAPNFIVLRSRKQRVSFLNGGKQQERSREFVALGAQFNYTAIDGTETITAKGPLYEEIIVLISFRAKTTVKAFVNYTIPKDKSLDSMFGEDVYEWKVVGWTKCSKVCGKGIQTLKTVCRNTQRKKSVSKRHCSLLEKPTIRKRTCNDFACSYTWKTDPWEYCSHTCGTKGIQHREVYCVVVISSKIVMNPKLCTEEKPAEEQSCNVYPCPASWEAGQWSKCSVTCGQGIRRRNVTCVPPENDVIYECSNSKPTETESCQEQQCLDKCTDDRSLYCHEGMLRYCISPNFYKLCCKSCGDYIKAQGQLPPW